MTESKENIRPKTSPKEAKDLLLEFYGLVACDVHEMDCYVDRTFYVRVERSKESREIGDEEFVLKVLNSVDSDAENEAQELLFQNGFSCPRIVKNLSKKLKSLITVEHQSGGVTYSKSHVVRLLTFVPGQILGDVPKSIHLFTSVGRYLAEVQTVLKDFKHPGIDNYETMWNMENVPKLRDFFQYIPDEEKLKLATNVILGFEANVVPMFYEVERGTIHSDFNEKNIIVNKVQEQHQGDQYEVTGIIDFGDLQRSCLIFDLTNAMTYMILENKGTCSDPVDVGGHVIKGYLSLRDVSKAEMEMMPYCVMGRYLQSLVLGAYSYSLDPDNKYLLTTAKEGWNRLGRLMELGAEKVLEKWMNIAKSN